MCVKQLLYTTVLELEETSKHVVTFLKVYKTGKQR